MERRLNLAVGSKNLTKSAMILADNLYFYKAKTLKDVYKSVYGYGFYYFSLSTKRYEKKKVFINSELNKLITIKMIRSFLPYNKNLHRRYQMHLYVLYMLKTYKSSRHVLGLPVRGQRT
ncbi:MAG: hypothetical protein KDH96_11935 [Candidatus Riesia sp.]|nr:hypothetical protein [Candidatus Riesia sp.]